MGAVRVKAVVCVLAIVMVNQAVFGDRGSSQMVENPRVERSGSETANGCEGSWCKSQRENPVGTIWFGPRLGRRRRSDTKLFPLRKSEQVGEIVDVPVLDLINMPASKLQRLGATSLGTEDKRQETTFTPRLGRELEGMYSMYDLARLLNEQIHEFEDTQEEQQQQQQPPNFPPRLGRTLAGPAGNRLNREYELRRLIQQLDL